MDVSPFSFNDSLGFLPQPTSPRQESSMVSASAPASSMSIDRSQSLAKKSEHQVQRGEADRRFKKQNRGKGAIGSILSNESVRRSPRFAGIIRLLQIYFLCLLKL